MVDFVVDAVVDDVIAAVGGVEKDEVFDCAVGGAVAEWVDAVAAGVAAALVHVVAAVVGKSVVEVLISCLVGYIAAVAPAALDNFAEFVAASWLNPAIGHGVVGAHSSVPVSTREFGQTSGSGCRNFVFVAVEEWID